MKLFDAHCHLQDPRIFNMVPQIIRTTRDTGVVHFAVNGVSEKDWPVVKEMSNNYPCVVPNFGIHPWFITERTPNWMKRLKEYFDATPEAAVGEIGLDKGSIGKKIDFADQVEVFRQQLELAKELKRPASIHCVRAYGDLLEILKSTGPFPSGVILHSFLGSAEMVPEFAKLGAYFSFSGFLMSLKESKAKKMLRSIPTERILLETDAPDAFPKLNNPDTLFFIAEEASASKESGGEGLIPIPDNDDSSETLPQKESGTSSMPKETLNHPANIHQVLDFVASILDMNKEKLADLSFSNAMQLFSYEGSKVLQRGVKLCC